MSSRSFLSACMLGAFALPAAVLAQSPPLTIKIGDQTKRTTGTVSELQNGDRACYMVLKEPNGKEFTELASFDICAMHIIGKRVQLTYKIEEIMAESCQGNPRCMKKDRVALVVEVKVLR